MHPKDWQGALCGSTAAWRWTFAGVIVVLLMPLALVEMPPLLDYPNHLARMYVLAHTGDPVLRQFYRPAWGITPYIAADALAVFLQHFMSIYAAGRIVLALAILLPLAGALTYARVNFGRAYLWHFCIGLLSYNALFLLGFFNFCISAGLAFLLAAAWTAYRDRFPVATTALSALGVAALFFVHIYGVPFYLALIGSRELGALLPLDRAFVGRAARRAVPLILTVVPVLLLSYYSGDMQPAGQGWDWGSPDLKLKQALFPLLQYQTRYGMVVPVVVYTALATFAVSGYFTYSRDAMIAAAILFAVFLAAPFRIGSIAEFVSTRFAVLALFVFLAGCVPSRMPALLQKITAAGIIGLLIFRTCVMGQLWQQEQVDVGLMKSAMAAIPEGSRVLSTTVSAKDDPDYWLHSPTGRSLPVYSSISNFPALLVIERKSFWPFLYAMPGITSIRVKPDYEDMAVAAGNPPSYKILDETDADFADDSIMKHWRDKFQYVLVIPADALPDAEHFHAADMEAVAINKFAAVYKVIPPSSQGPATAPVK